MLTMWLGDEKTLQEKEVKRVLREPARVRVGKSGLNEGVISEIRRHLEKEGVVKVKVLKTALIKTDVNGVATETAKKLNAELVDVRGHTFTLRRRKRE